MRATLVAFEQQPRTRPRRDEAGAARAAGGEPLRALHCVRRLVSAPWILSVRVSMVQNAPTLPSIIPSHTRNHTALPEID